MLVLSRQRGETLKIGSDIDITVVDVRGDKVRLGIIAPRTVEVHRKEIYEAIQRQNIASAELQPGDFPARLPRPQSAPLPVPPPAPLPEKITGRPETSSLFTPWKDPASGVESYILTQRLAPAQQAMRPSGAPFTPDGRFLWFQCATSGGSAAGWTLGVVDFQEQNLHHFTEKHFPGAALPVDPQAGRSWWQTDGSHLWFADEAGTQRLNPRTRQVEMIWPAGTGHSHCDPAGQYLAGDIGAETWERCSVAFFNRRTGMRINIASALPRPPLPPAGSGLAPCPQFCMDGRYICYTTTALGRVDVAIVPVAPLAAATA